VAYNISLRHWHSRTAVLTFQIELKSIPLISRLSHKCVFFCSLHNVMFCKKCLWPVRMSPWSQRSAFACPQPHRSLSLQQYRSWNGCRHRKRRAIIVILMEKNRKYSLKSKMEIITFRLEMHCPCQCQISAPHTSVWTLVRKILCLSLALIK